ncbi:lytic murein transglycosylase B [Marinicellulosiphila megalodicopiae]|uniref:lytic murein transglycosylase B n=1 Tax=Marinicellulosiphila megalodicopiae TaxID=2724896 RepID=UPI003BAF5BCF
MTVSFRIFCCLIVLSFFSTLLSAQSFYEHPKAKSVIKELVEDHGLNEEKLIQWLKKGQYSQSTVKNLAKPAEKTKTLKEYAPLFVEPNSIKNGIEFYKTNEAALLRAQEKFGVPATIITAIIGIETRYGNYTGKSITFNALGTTAFSDQSRNEFFMREFKAFLQICHEQNLDPFELKGSYAGAMGIGQFMPTSYQVYAVDFNDDGKINIWTDLEDAIGSVANYLKAHKWDASDDIVLRATVAQNSKSEVNRATIKVATSLDHLLVDGWEVKQSTKSFEKVYPIRLDGEHGVEYWVGLPNFRVITRYNHSVRYAMTVFLLHQKILESL